MTAMIGSNPNPKYPDTEWCYISEYDEWVRTSEGYLQSSLDQDHEDACDVENPGETYDDAVHFLKLANKGLGTAWTPEDWNIIPEVATV
jgi:hypothetical protein